MRIRSCFLLCCFLIVAVEVKSQEVKLRFIDQDMEIKDQVAKFKLFIVIEDSISKVVIRPQIDKGHFTLPKFCLDKKGIIILKFRDKYLAFPDRSLNIDQDMEWIFGTKKQNPKVNKGVRMINFLRFNPLSHGDGVQVDSYIENEERYNNEIIALLKL